MRKSMMVALAFFALGLAQAQATELPSLDIDAYCARVAEAVGGSYEIEKTCRDSEAEAKTALENREEVEARIMNYCERVARAIGGSYEILKTCIEGEEEAREAMQGD